MHVSGSNIYKLFYCHWKSTTVTENHVQQIIDKIIIIINNYNNIDSVCVYKLV